MTEPLTDEEAIVETSRTAIAEECKAKSKHGVYPCRLRFRHEGEHVAVYGIRMMERWPRGAGDD